MDSVLYAACNTAEDFPGGISGMAAAIGKNKFSLAHELSETGSAKLGLVDAVKMVKRAKDLRIVNAIATECGCLVLPLPEALLAEGTDPLRDLASVSKEFADLVQEVIADTTDDAISANELARLEREGSQCVAAIVQLMAHLRSKHEASQPASRVVLRAA